jgi:hypothetical protein
MMVYLVLGELLKKLQKVTTHAEQLLDLNLQEELVTTQLETA